MRSQNSFIGFAVRSAALCKILVVVVTRHLNDFKFVLGADAVIKQGQVFGSNKVLQYACFSVQWLLHEALFLSSYGSPTLASGVAA